MIDSVFRALALWSAALLRRFISNAD